MKYFDFKNCLVRSLVGGRSLEVIWSCLGKKFSCFSGRKFSCCNIGKNFELLFYNVSLMFWESFRKIFGIISIFGSFFYI